MTGIDDKIAELKTLADAFHTNLELPDCMNAARLCDVMVQILQWIKDHDERRNKINRMLGRQS